MTIILRTKNSVADPLKLGLVIMKRGLAILSERETMETSQVTLDVPVAANYFLEPPSNV